MLKLLHNHFNSPNLTRPAKFCQKIDFLLYHGGELTTYPYKLRQENFSLTLGVHVHAVRP